MYDGCMMAKRNLGSGGIDATPLVSAIIIFLDAERFIEEAIESVFARTYRDWELLLVDDGSTDGGTRIAREYAERNAAWPLDVDNRGSTVTMAIDSQGTCANCSDGFEKEPWVLVIFMLVELGAGEAESPTLPTSLRDVAQGFSQSSTESPSRALLFCVHVHLRPPSSLGCYSGAPLALLRKKV